MQSLTAWSMKALKSLTVTCLISSGSVTNTQASLPMYIVAGGMVYTDLKTQLEIEYFVNFACQSWRGLDCKLNSQKNIIILYSPLKIYAIFIE